LPDLEISNLPALAGASLQATDPVAVADLSAAETKKITIKDLLEGGFDLVDDATIPAAKISGSTVGVGAVDTTQLADLAVTTAKIDTGAVSFAKIQDINTNVLLGRSTAGTGDVEEITCTSAGRALLDDADASAQRTTLGLGTLATQSGTFSGTSSGTNTGDQTITLTGDVTGSGTGTFAASLSAGSVDTTELVDGAVTYAKIQDTSDTNIILGRASIGAGSVEEITCTSAGRALLDDATAADQRTTLGLGDLAVATGTWANGSSFSGISSGTNTGDQTITLTGDVTGSGTGAFTTTIANNAIDTANVNNAAITYAKIQNVSSGDILLGRISGAGSIQEITCTSAGRALLDDATAADQRTTLGLGTLALANGTWANGSSFSGTSSGTNTGDQTITLTGDVTGSGTGTFAVTISAGAVDTTQIADLAVTYGKTNFADGSIPGTKLQTNSVTATQLAENSVGASELADNSVDTNALIDGNVTDIKLANGIDGAKLSNDTVTAAKIPSDSLDRGLDKTTNSIGHTNAITAGTRSGISFDAQGHITSTAALVASDMPLATTTDVGAVSVAADSGLTVSGTGAISIANTLAGGTTSGITFDDNGLITAATALVPSDLPGASASQIGAVSIPSGGGLEVDGDGAISISNSGVSAGTYPKVTVNAKGIVTAGENLIAADIPAFDASKITSGTIDIARIAANSITGEKLADSSTVTFAGAGSSSGVVTFPAADFQGKFFFDAINRDLYLWDGNAWQPVTITSGEIIFAGTYDASTNLVASVTTAGQAAGLTVGAAIPAASADNRQYYLVVSELGTGTAPAPAVSLNPPDILLSSGTSWELLDVSSFVAAQQANNISFTPYGTISSNNVQAALEELDTEKLGKAGGTVTGNIEISSTGSLTFEGSTADAFEATLAVVDPTADRTLTLPDVDGTIITSGDSDTVTSAMIADGTIVNADINASAGIAFSKLATLTSAHFLLGNSSNVATATQITGDISVSNSGVVAITAGSIVDADISGSAAITATKIQAATTSNAGVVQLNNTTSSTSTTQAATANAVKTAYDLIASAMPKAGGTFTGAVTIGNTGSLLFEGATDNAFETTLAVTDPTADRTITLPDTTGTVALTSQLDDGTY
jgi:hypothetical protein